MALVLNDRVRETTTIVGTGTATLLGAVTGYQAFSVVGNGNTTYYCISDQGGPNWEVGIGTYTSSGTTLARTTVLASSNAGALVSFTAGTKDVFVTYPSEKGVWYDASGNVLFTGTTTAGNLAYTGTFTGGTGVVAIGTNQIYKDASGNVGIGTSSPSSYGKLAILGTSGNVVSNVVNTGVTAGNTAQQILTANTYTLTTTVNANGNTTQYANGAFYGCGTTSASFMVLVTNNLERMRIDSSGNVGIGTMVPTNTASYGTLSLNGTNGGQLVFQTAGAYKQSIYSTGTDLNILNSQAGIVTLATNSLERIRIDSSGNVGIGTITPNASAILDAQSTTKGVRFPNMTTTQKTAISSPAAGLVVFDTTLAKLCVYSGAAWQTITSV